MTYELVSRVEGEVVQLDVHVDGEDLCQVDQLLQSLVDEDDADEGGKRLLGEAGDVTDQGAGVGGDQQEAQEGRPQTDAGPQRQVGQTVVTEDNQRRQEGGQWKRLDHQPHDYITNIYCQIPASC